MSSFSSYAVALTPTPLLNTPDFTSSFGGPSGTSIPLDSSNLLKSIESVAFKGSKFKILEEMSTYIVRASAPQHSPEDVYIDRRFLRFVDEEPPERKGSMPTIPTILQTLESLQGISYIWGGTWPFGIPSLIEYYPPQIDLLRAGPLIADTWQLKGIDCSGLMYYATDGNTPRNTAQLIHYGQPVSIEGKNPQEIVETLNDLDLIVWKGHVVIVWDSSQSIESLVGHGVIKQPLIKRIEEIMVEKKKIPVDEYETRPELNDKFVVRRWHPDNI